MVNVFSLGLAFLFVAYGDCLHEQLVTKFTVFKALNGLLESTDLFKRSDCSIDCAVSMIHKVVESRVSGFDKGKELRETPVAMIPVTKEDFNAYCQDVIKPFFTCMAACPSSSAKTIMATAFDLLKLICIDKYQGIYDNYDCFQKKNSISNEQCSRACKSFSGAVTAFEAENENLIKTGNWDRYEQLAGGYCKFANCSYECEKPISVKVCGINNTIASSLNKELLHTTVKSFKKVLFMVSEDDYWPSECEATLESTGSGAAGLGSWLTGYLFALFLVVCKFM